MTKTNDELEFAISQAPYEVSALVRKLYTLSYLQQAFIINNGVATKEQRDVQLFVINDNPTLKNVSRLISYLINMEETPLNSKLTEELENNDYTNITNIMLVNITPIKNQIAVIDLYQKLVHNFNVIKPVSDNRIITTPYKTGFNLNYLLLTFQAYPVLFSLGLWLKNANKYSFGLFNDQDQQLFATKMVLLNTNQQEEPLTWQVYQKQIINLARPLALTTLKNLYHQQLTNLKQAITQNILTTQDEHMNSIYTLSSDFLVLDYDKTANLPIKQNLATYVDLDDFLHKKEYQTVFNYLSKNCI